MTSQSLTSMKQEDSFRDESQRPLSPQEIEQTRLAGIRGEIVVLSRQKDDLHSELERLNRATELTKDRLKSDTEVKRLRIQKKGLLREVKRITVLLFSLKDSHGKVITSFKEFGQDRLNFLESIARALDLDVKDFSVKLKKKSKQSDKREQFLTELSEFYEQYAAKVEAGASQNALEHTKIKKMTVDTSNKQKEIKKLEKLTKERLNRVDRINITADKRYTDAAELVEFFKGKADKERDRLKRWSHGIYLYNESVKAKEKFLVGEKKRLEKKEIQLIDKEGTLRRVATELRKK